MKILIFATGLLVSVMAMAQSPTENISAQMAQQGCVPHRDQNGEISRLDCNKQTGKQYQMLGVRKSNQLLRTSPNQNDLDQNFQKSLRNSSPQVQQAYLKAAKELEEKKKIESENR